MTCQTRVIDRIRPTRFTDKQGRVWPGTMITLSCGHERHIGGAVLPMTAFWQCGTSPCYVPGKDFAA